MSAYTLNPGQQFYLESEKGYKFSAFLDSSFSQDANYSDFTDAERYIKYNLILNATGYIIAPNIKGGKTALRSFLSAPEIYFDVVANDEDVFPVDGAVQDGEAASNIFDDLLTEDGEVPSQVVGGIGLDRKLRTFDADKSGLSVVGGGNKNTEVVGERGTDYSKKRKTYVKNANGELVPVMAKLSRGKGETIYDAKLGEVLFNISASD